MAHCTHLGRGWSLQINPDLLFYGLWVDSFPDCGFPSEAVVEKLVQEELEDLI